MSNVFTIPAGVPFADALAKELQRRAGGKPEALARMRVLLPTRRAGRAVRQSFLNLHGGRPLLLPRLQPLGDADEDELAFEDAAADIPPATAPLRRQMLLAKLILARSDGPSGAAPALALAAELARLLDRLHTEGLDVAAFAGLAGEQFAEHWQVTLDFLTIIGEQWPKLLAAEGAIDPADRRNRLLRAQGLAWTARPPQTPVIAAGITGSIPAAAELLGVIARLPQGAIILPGFDPAMSDDDRATLDPAHPQAALDQLLRRLDVAPTAVRLIAAPDKTGETDRARLAREALRPAADTADWTALQDDATTQGRLREGLNGVIRIDADTPQEEALAIALLLRETLETPGRTAALVTPDRDLARRVAAACRRWDIAIDDSAGLPLAQTPVGVFLRLILRAVERQLAPAALLALLHHDLCRLGLPVDARRVQVSALDRALRGPRPLPGLAGLRARTDEAHALLLNRIEEALKPLLDLPTHTIFTSWLNALLQVAESLAAMPEESGHEILWNGEAGEAAATLLADLRDQPDLLPPEDAAGFRATLEQIMRPVTVRPVWGMQARLAILGRLEARLLQPDLVILGSLNEGSWPPEAGHDPWLSRPMLAQLGLPPPEQAVGLAAHDFVQGFCAAQVVLTRAKRSGGAPTVPSRWLQRIDAMLDAAGLDASIPNRAGEKYLAWARAADQCKDQKPAQRPEPAPPLHTRPRKLPVTDIDTWLRDPYQIYARRILRLPVLKPLEQPADAAARGTLLHAVLRDTVGAPLNELQQRMLARGRQYIAQRADEPGFWEFWWPRFERIAQWVTEKETGWRQDATLAGVEIEGRMILPTQGGDFTLTARADRIDRLRDGSYALIDFKSGGEHGKKKIASGLAPQLGLEALILAHGGFDGISVAEVSYLAYWILKGDRKTGEVIAVDEDVDVTLQTVYDGLLRLIEEFDDPRTAYMSVPNADHPPRYNDYAQLARLQEWTALGEIEDSEAA